MSGFVRGTGLMINLVEMVLLLKLLLTASRMALKLLKHMKYMDW